MFVRAVALSSVALSSLALSNCFAPLGAGTEGLLTPAQGTPTLSPIVPVDIEGGAPKATIEAAATFAWQEFIALNWPAVAQTGMPGTRGAANPKQPFGASDAPALVWETYRNKVEIYPGQNSNSPGTPVVKPNGFEDDAATSYGFDAAPQYLYDPKQVGIYPNLPLGEIPSADPKAPNTTPAFVNLDEDNEIDEAAMFAGASSLSSFPGQQFLYAAKANRVEYEYVAGNRWWYKDSGKGTPPFEQTTTFVAKNKSTPPPGSTDLVSLPSGTIEVKSAWRRLTPTELRSGRFHVQTVRFYVPTKTADGATRPAWREEAWGLCGLHIIHKTPTAPYFVYATFGQVDNLLDVNGTPAEDAAGNLSPAVAALTPMDPEIVSIPATSTTAQVLTAQGPSPDPGKRLHYENLPDGYPGHRVPQGKISVNRRVHSIPAEIIAVNETYQAAIAAYDEANKVERSPWRYYRLVNVQWVPLDKEPGKTYSGPHPASYYLSNEVIETDYNLQQFSGKLDDATNPDGLITDYTPSVRGTILPPYVPITNTPFAGHEFNMGGCMGCHGNIAELGADFSFILFKSSVSSPEFQLEFQEQ